MDNSGKIMAGVAYAKGKADLFSNFQKSNNFVLSLKRIKESEKSPIKSFTLLFFKNLRLFIKNKIDLFEALKISLFLFKAPEKKAIIQYIIDSIENGTSFSKSLSLFPRYFDGVVIKSMEVAESTATLDQTILSVITYLQEKQTTREEIKNAMIYPIILFCVMFSILTFWMVYIVPNFVDLFSDVGIELPLSTRIVVAFRYFILNYGWIMVLLLILLFKTKFINIRRIFYRLPILSKYSRDLKVLNFSLSMKIMLQNKIDLLSALKCCESPELNIDIVVNKIKKGTNFFLSLVSLNIFHEYEIAIIRAGEKSGTLQQSFEILSDILQQIVKSRTTKLINMIQPIMILVIGILLIIVIYAVFIPLYSNLNLDF